MKQYIINKDKLEILLRESQLLNALIAGGVEDWQWYFDSIDEFEKDFGCNIDDVEDMLYNFPIYKNDMDEAEELYNELDNISRT